MLVDSPSRNASMLREAAHRARRLGRPVLASWTTPSSLDALGFFSEAASEVDRLLWLRPESGEALVGLGAARTLLGLGADRFNQVSSEWRDLLQDAVTDDVPSAGPLLLGGFSFDPLGQAHSSLWSGFPDARLVLPRRMLQVGESGAWLTTNVVVGPDGQDFDAPDVESATGADPALSPTLWKTLVGSVARGIRTGQLGVDKVVLARSEGCQQRRPIDLQGALRNLAAGYPSCTVFAVGHRGKCFLGATPERLIALHNGTASTAALAGSGPRGRTPDQDECLAEQLLRDPKERAEHAIVVAALRDGLSQVCTRVVADAQPQVTKLANLQHLLTPIRGQVGEGIGVLDLVERLHPSPAVGGFPRQPALELIRDCESLDRGWYAGPIGWVNRAGEGEFVVAIRSAVVDTGAHQATLFAGCGIVADSDAATELAESGWKLQPMRAALGMDP